MALLGNEVDLDAFDSFANTVSISLSRSEIPEIRELLPTSWTLVWAALSKLKVLAQWKTKLHSLGAPEADINKFNISQIGNYLFEHLTVNGTIVPLALQPPPLP